MADADRQDRVLNGPLTPGGALLAGLRDGTLPPAQFNHRNHVYAAWQCLEEGQLRIAAHRFKDLLLGYVEKVGAQDKFHLTLTFAFMHLIHERRLRSPAGWEAFAAANPDLFANARELVARFYSPGRLMNEQARREFVEPDLQELPFPNG